MKVLIVGVPRQSEVVIKSIWENILTPNQLNESHVKVFLNKVNEFRGGRSKDNGKLDESNYSKYINSFDTTIYNNNDEGIDRLAPDPYKDNYISLSNLYSYLNLLYHASNVIENNEPVVLIRPDTQILDVLPLGSKFLRWGFVVLPAWQDWSGGFNDRYIIGCGNQVRRVMRRKDLISNLINELKPLKSELLMKYSLRRSLVIFTNSRVQRLRNDEANFVDECFKPNYLRCYLKMALNF